MKVNKQTKTKPSRCCERRIFNTGGREDVSLIQLLRMVQEIVGKRADVEYAPARRRPCQLVQQTGEGKGDAVCLGFARARGDMLMILDADLTVPLKD
jgi:nucleoside-diphosphate-sugar epimerase